MKRISKAAWLVLSVLRGFSAGRALLAPFGLCSLALVAMIVPVVGASEKSSTQTEGGSILTQIRVIQPEGGVQENLLKPELDQIAAIRGVIGWFPEDAATLYASDEADIAWSATVLVADQATLPTEIPLRIFKELTPDQIIVPEVIEGEKMKKWLGKPMPATYTKTVDRTGESQKIALSVVAVYPATWSPPYPGTFFASQPLVIRLLAAERGVPADEFLTKFGFSRVTVNVDSTQAVDSVVEELRHLGLDAYPLRDRLGGLPETIEMLPGLILLVGLITLLCATAFVVFATRFSLRRRKQEFGLLRMRGWRKSDVLWLVVADVSLGAIVGATLGTLLGLGAGFLISSSVLGGDYYSAATAAPVVASWAGIVVIASSTALLTAAAGLRRDPFVEIMVPA